LIVLRVLSVFFLIFNSTLSLQDNSFHDFQDLSEKARWDLSAQSTYCVTVDTTLLTISWHVKISQGYLDFSWLSRLINMLSWKFQPKHLKVNIKVKTYDCIGQILINSWYYPFDNFLDISRPVKVIKIFHGLSICLAENFNQNMSRPKSRPLRVLVNYLLTDYAAIMILPWHVKTC
jgi:hypothetical protein